MTTLIDFIDVSRHLEWAQGKLVQHRFVHSSLRFGEVHWRSRGAAAYLRHVEHVKVINWVNDEDRASYTLPAEIERAFIVSARNRLEMEAQTPVAARSEKESTTVDILADEFLLHC